MKYAVAFIAVFFVSIHSFCQRDDVSQNMISGKVIEQKGKSPVRKARITIRNAENNLVLYNLRSDDKGTFSFPSGNFASFKLEVEKLFYETFNSEIFNIKDVLKRTGFTLPDILLKSSIEYNPVAKDTVPLPPREFLAKSVYKFDILPTPSCYELYYDLNPGLREMQLVPAGLEITRPKTPEFTKQEKNNYKAILNNASEKDRTAQQTLRDSIAVLNNLYQDYLTIVKMNYGQISRDTFRMLLKIINTDLSNYSDEIKSLSKAKASQLGNLVLATNILLRETGSTLETSPSDYEQVIALARDVSAVVESKYFQEYFYGSDNSSKAFATNLNYPPANYAEQNSSINNGALGTDIRMFKVSVHLQKNGRVISSGPEVEKKFVVTFFPGALKKMKILHVNCQPLATYGGVTLLQGIYQHAVIDSETEKEMTIIGSDLFNTMSAFEKPAKTLLGPNITEIQIYVK